MISRLGKGGNSAIFCYQIETVSAQDCTHIDCLIGGGSCSSTNHFAYRRQTLELSAARRPLCYLPIPAPVLRSKERASWTNRHRFKPIKHSLGAQWSLYPNGMLLDRHLPLPERQRLKFSLQQPRCSFPQASKPLSYSLISVVEALILRFHFYILA